MDEPWQIFIDELRAHAEGVVEHTLGRADEWMDAAHEAYQSTSDLLVTEHDYDEEEALALARVFAEGVEKWVDDGQDDGQTEWEELRERLEMLQQEWELKGDVPA